MTSQRSGSSTRSAIESPAHLSRRSLLSSLALGAASLAIPAYAQTAPLRTLVRNVRIFDGVSPLLRNGHVLLEGSRILGVSSSQIAEEGIATVIDGQGRVLMPGLTDAHWHMTFAASTFADFGQFDLGLLYAKSVAEAERTLLRGFTTIRDVGGPVFGLKSAIDAGIVPGPRCFPSGALISQTGGHNDHTAPYDTPRTLGGEPSHLDVAGVSVVANGPAEVLAGVRDQLRKGASQIKLTVGGGVISDYDPIDSVQFIPEELRVAVQAARDWGTYVAAHVYTSAGIRRALEGGVLSIEHGHLADADTIGLMAEKGAWLSTQALEPGDNDLSPAQLAKVASTGMIGSWRPALENARRHGTKIAFGTDLLFQRPGRTMQNTMITRFAEVLGNAEALRIVTSGNCELFAQSGQRNPYRDAPLGVVREGAWADLLLVDGDPLTDISLLADPENNLKTIIKNGQIVKNTI